MQDFEAKRFDRQIHSLRLFQKGFLQRGIGERKFVFPLADADLYAIEPQLLGQGDGFDLAFQFQVPVSNPNLEPDLRRRTQAGQTQGREGRRGTRADKGTASEQLHNHSSWPSGPIIRLLL